jgi:hypothetical protein
MSNQDFRLGDETDQRLVIAISHQFLRAESAFARLNRYIARPSQLSSVVTPLRLFQDERQWEIDVYNAYVDFLQNLYEYLIACFKRDRHSLADIDYKDTDTLIRIEAEKYHRNCLLLIAAGRGAEFGLNHKEYYEEPVPSDFGTKFRYARNMNTHADVRRVDTGFMAKFFQGYHRFVMNLFFLGYGHWSADNEKTIPWKDISEFAKIVFPKQ